MKSIKNFLIQLLIFPKLRTKFCKFRWKMRKGDMRLLNSLSPEVKQEVVEYNLAAFHHDAAFGCGNRMAIILNPLAALIQEKSSANVLIIGPRTEDDIYLAKALGFVHSKGVDLFSYSPYVDLGDCHALAYADAEFDAVVMGWVVAYSGNPQLALDEAKRVLKPNGYLAIGWEWLPKSQLNDPSKNRINTVNEVDEYLKMVNLKPVFLNDPDISGNHNKSLIFKKGA